MRQRKPETGIAGFKKKARVQDVVKSLFPKDYALCLVRLQKFDSQEIVSYEVYRSI